VPKIAFILKQSEFEMSLLILKCTQSLDLKGFIEDHDGMHYFRKMDGSDERTRLDGRKTNRTLHAKLCILHIFLGMR